MPAPKLINFTKISRNESILTVKMLKDDYDGKRNHLVIETNIVDEVKTNLIQILTNNNYGYKINQIKHNEFSIIMEKDLEIEDYYSNLIFDIEKIIFNSEKAKILYIVNKNYDIFTRVSISINKKSKIDFYTNRDSCYNYYKAIFSIN
jgi:hypothetical protein